MFCFFLNEIRFLNSSDVGRRLSTIDQVADIGYENIWRPSRRRELQTSDEVIGEEFIADYVDCINQEESIEEI